mgnify:CR=1 FL=1
MTEIQVVDLNLIDEVKKLQEEIKIMKERKVPKNEQEFIEMSNHFKDEMEDKEREVIKYKKKFMEERKRFGRIYGLICELQVYIESISDIGGDPVYETLAGSIRALVSTTLFGSLERDLCLNDDEDILLYMATA